MPQYREKETGVVKSHSEVRKIHRNVSFSSVVDTYAELGWDKLVEVARPEPSSILKLVVEDAPVVIDGKWPQVWVETDKFDNSGGGTSFTGGISTNYSAFSAPTGRIGPDYFFGEFSWGKIVLVDRASATNSFDSYNDRGAVGITTGDHVIRNKKMKFKNYST